MNVQDTVTFLIVAGAVAFLVDRFAFASRRRGKSTSKAPDVSVEALVRKRKKR